MNTDSSVMNINGSVIHILRYLYDVIVLKIRIVNCDYRCLSISWQQL